MTDPTFVSNRIAELPACFRDAEGIAWATGMGTVQDDEMALWRIAALSRFPQFCPDDALDLCGTWLLLPRLPDEPNGTTTTGYRGRLCAAWDTWIKAGSKGGIIDSLISWGASAVTVENRYEYDPGAEWWSMFRVNVTTPTIEPMIWGVFVWGDTSTWGSTATVEQVSQILMQIYQWKWAYGIPEELILTFADATTATIPLVWIWGDDANMTWGSFEWGNDPLVT